MGATILGASFDTPEENLAFAEAQGFPYRLLSDADRSVATAYGAARPPDHDFASVPKRVTFLIDPQGVVQRVWEVKDVAANAGEVLDAIHAASAR